LLQTAGPAPGDYQWLPAADDTSTMSWPALRAPVLFCSECGGSGFSSMLSHNQKAKGPHSKQRALRSPSIDSSEQGFVLTACTISPRHRDPRSPEIVTRCRGSVLRLCCPRKSFISQVYFCLEPFHGFGFSPLGERKRTDLPCFLCNAAGISSGKAAQNGRIVIPTFKAAR
jgi:hypothetical protein